MYIYRIMIVLCMVIRSYVSITSTPICGSITVTLPYGSITITLLYGSITITLLYERITITLPRESITIMLLHGNIKITLLCRNIKITLLRGSKWPALPVCADTSHAGPALTKTVVPKPTTTEVVVGGNINSNCDWPMDCQTASPSPLVDPYSDFTLAASFGGSDGNSDYVESSKNSPTSPTDTSELVWYISELEEMHELS